MLHVVDGKNHCVIFFRKRKRRAVFAVIGKFLKLFNQYFIAFFRIILDYSIKYL